MRIEDGRVSFLFRINLALIPLDNLYHVCARSRVSEIRFESIVQPEMESYSRKYTISKTLRFCGKWEKNLESLTVTFLSQALRSRPSRARETRTTYVTRLTLALSQC